MTRSQRSPRRNRTDNIVRWEKATITSVSPLMAFYDGDSAGDAVPVNHLAPGLTSVSVGQRYFITLYGGIAIISAAWAP